MNVSREQYEQYGRQARNAYHNVLAAAARPSREDLEALREDLEALQGPQEVFIQPGTNLSRNIIYFSHQGINYMFRRSRRGAVQAAWSILTRSIRAQTQAQTQAQVPVQVQVEADDLRRLIRNSGVRLEEQDRSNIS